MANKYLAAKGITGNTGYSLDSIPSNILKNGDMAVVQNINTDKVYYYKFVESTNKNQSVPDVIIPYDSVDSSNYGTWEILSLYFSEEALDEIADNINAKSFIITQADWNVSLDDTVTLTYNFLNSSLEFEGISELYGATNLYYYNITHNLNETHPIVFCWNTDTNEPVNVTIVSSDENSIRIEHVDDLNLKIKVLK